MDPFTSEVWAAERRRELAAEAAQRRLAAAATCCRPSGLTRAGDRLRNAWVALRASSDTPCCSPA
jgi:hypothetical protein